MIDPNRALDPGLINNATTKDYVGLLNQTLAIVRTCPMMIYYNTDI